MNQQDFGARGVKEGMLATAINCSVHVREDNERKNDNSNKHNAASVFIELNTSDWSKDHQQHAVTHAYSESTGPESRRNH
jgi:hypothetical protein